MKLKWTDSLEIALALIEKQPNQDPLLLHFTQLREWIIQLDEFDDDPAHCSERILEAIQQCWIDEH
ncbi:Fe-S cluster assembly protein IscX [Psychromonas antarctica]|jgi:FeS assembly protein IscX|uniref:Fe-S cluster assembly protein IscX n=1 Tax=Psychromonas antarctica TaxID=67573 RepID=UPI001EE80C4D|nr:Fe-S cluster assembly protein IscX [Psychromonas antarctica]MCG6202354.1 Fe-S cluster assembly protein IscX [Psychromonas antarctica]